MKVFVSGSRGVRELPAAAKAARNKIRELGFTVHVGDCYGVDALVQAYSEGYLKVVFHIGAMPRTNLGFDTVRIVGSKQTDKDAAMAAAADYGLAIWDGKSSGTAKNIKRVGTIKVVRA